MKGVVYLWDMTFSMYDFFLFAFVLLAPFFFHANTAIGALDISTLFPPLELSSFNSAGTAGIFGTLSMTIAVAEVAAMAVASALARFTASEDRRGGGTGDPAADDEPDDEYPPPAPAVARCALRAAPALARIWGEIEDEEGMAGTGGTSVDGCVDERFVDDEDEDEEVGGERSDAGVATVGVDLELERERASDSEDEEAVVSAGVGADEKDEEVDELDDEEEEEA